MRLLVLAFALLCASVFSLSGALAGPVRKAAKPCGVYRWPVKTLTDADARRIDWTPVRTTIRHLESLPRPAKSPTNRRTRYELHVYRVKARLVGVRHTLLDHDYHLLLVDPTDPGARMIAEIPAPECAKGSGHRAAFAAARRRADAIYARIRHPWVSVTGVGFFDSLFHAHGHYHARNGFELHPVLSIRALRTGHRRHGAAFAKP
ncbi:MAG: hypothetical protein M0T84_05865 [Betaproteobacteria bacterium]|nr:hypothetical protein [Betaproteobacteria bacterium]